MPNLEPYLEQILSDDDKTLFGEATVSAANGAPRGAYILLWLSAAESLKRKFKEAALRDGRAGQIIGEIRQGEEQHKSVDLLILKRAKEYGFIDDTAYQKLEYVYNLRCLYGHPYESAPSEIELESAAEVVVTTVLSKPTTLKQGFVDSTIKSLYNDINFLEHSQPAVYSFANDIVDRIDPSVFAYLVDKYSALLENSFEDPTLKVVNLRGIWFVSRFLEVVGTDFYTPSQWHDFCSKYPYVAMAIFTYDVDLFESLSVLPRNYIINTLLSRSSTVPTLAERLERLIDRSLLSTGQLSRFNEISIHTAKSSGIRIKTAFDIVLKAFKSYNWYSQNPASDIIYRNDRSELSELNPDQLEELGRNILQAAQGDSGSAITLLHEFATNQEGLPEPLIRGIVLEAFVNESNQFRLKISQMESVLELLKSRPELITELSAALSSATPKVFTSSSDYDDLSGAIEAHPELHSLHGVLLSERTRLRSFEE